MGFIKIENRRPPKSEWSVSNSIELPTFGLSTEIKHIMDALFRGKMDNSIAIRNTPSGFYTVILSKLI